MGSPSAEGRPGWRDRLPEPAKLTDEEIARQKRANRRVGTVVAAVCILVSLVAAAIFLTMNRDTADDGAPAPLEAGAAS